MYDFMLNNSIYLVLVIFLVGLVGICSYLVRMGSQVAKLEKE